MIVICTNCHAKFKVADEKIGPRGAKVRCSRCRSVFQVGAGAVPPPLPPSRGPAAPAEPRAGVDLESPLGAPAAPAEPDPFAAAGLGLSLQRPASTPPPTDPFAAVPAPDDPFAPQPARDPFAAPAPTPSPESPEGGRLAVTDLSQLLGAARAAEPAPAPPAVAPSLGLDELSSGGLALEDRVTPPPLPPRHALEPEGGLVPVQSADAFVMGEPAAFGAYELGAGADEPLALASEPAVAEPAPPPPPPAPPRVLEPAAAPMTLEPVAMATAPAARAAHDRAAPATEERGPPRRSAVWAVLVNAVALAALLVVALALLAVWRSEGPFDASSLKPAALLAALRHGGAPGTFPAVEIRSGVYDRERAPPLLFVRGKIVSRATAPVRRVAVVAEVVRAGGVVARGEALAGALPTPEELYGAADDSALAAVVRAASARAPAQVRPGDAVPFLVAIPDPPAELDGASIRVRAAVAGRAPP